MADFARAYFQASYVQRESQYLVAPEPFVTTGNPDLVVSGANPYNPFGQDLTSIQRRLTDISGRGGGFDVNTLRIVTGIDGTLGEFAGPATGWYWDASVNYGRTYGTFTNTGFLNTQKTGPGLGPGFVDADGAHCGTTKSPIENCTPIDLFGAPGTIDPAMATQLGAYTGVNRGTQPALHRSREPERTAVQARFRPSGGPCHRVRAPQRVRQLHQPADRRGRVGQRHRIARPVRRRVAASTSTRIRRVGGAGDQPRSVRRGGGSLGGGARVQVQHLRFRLDLLLGARWSPIAARRRLAARTRRRSALPTSSSSSRGRRAASSSPRTIPAPTRMETRRSAARCNAAPGTAGGREHGRQWQSTSRRSTP